MKKKIILDNISFTLKMPFFDIQWNPTQKLSLQNSHIWEYACDGNVPSKAAAAGYEADGKALYIARAKYADGIHIGKIRPEFRAANIPFGGEEIQISQYEVYIGILNWKAACKGEIPIGAIVAGCESDNTPLYVSRVKYENGVHIGKVRPEFKAANIPFGGKEIQVDLYEVLTLD